MTTDRELLELAARAAGMDGWWESAYLSFILRAGGPWRPLTDDGDALRLAVKLRLEISWWKTGVSAESQDCAPVGIQPFNDDPAAATRLAITRAAAAIGEAMP